MNIILAGGINEGKYKKISADLIEALQSEKIDVKTTYVNTYEKTDLTNLEEGMDLVITLGTNQAKTNLPTVNGMGLLYPWMGKDKVMAEIKEYQ